MSSTPHRQQRLNQPAAGQYIARRCRNDGHQAETAAFIANDITVWFRFEAAIGTPIQQALNSLLCAYRSEEPDAAARLELLECACNMHAEPVASRRYDYLERQ